MPGWAEALVWALAWLALGGLVWLASWLSPARCAARRAARRAAQAGAVLLSQGPDGTWRAAA